MRKKEQISKAYPIAGKSIGLVLVISLLVGWLILTPGGLLGKADAVGYAVCHRIDARSFFLGERQLPLCARCSGMYLGAMTGLVLQTILFPRRAGMPHWRLWILLGVFVLAFGIDGINSYLHLYPNAPSLYEPNNLIRLVTGSGMGLVIAFVIYPAFNQTAWKNLDLQPALDGFRFLVLAVSITLLVDWLVWLENPLLLLIFALVSAFGVLLLLTMVYSVFWMMLLKLDNRLEKLSALIIPLTLGFGVAILQIALFDFLRFTFTGTWDGFHLG